jgi:hypothetical protein
MTCCSTTTTTTSSTTTTITTTTTTTSYVMFFFDPPELLGERVKKTPRTPYLPATLNPVGTSPPPSTR